MFDLGWQEFILIAIITVIVVGPKDLPRVVRSISQTVRKARSMAREFQNSLEEVAREAELEDVRREMQSISKDGIGKTLEKQFDPDGSVRSSVEEARKSANAEEIEADLKSIHGDATGGADTKKAVTTAPAVETAEDYAAKSVTAATPKPIPPAEPDAPTADEPKKTTRPKTTPAKTTPAKTPRAKTTRPKADSASSGQG